MVVALGVWTAPASAAVFWWSSGSGFIERAAQDGSHVEPSFLNLHDAGANGGDEVVVAGDDVYWAQAGGTTIGRAHITASGVSSSEPRFITGITSVNALAVSGGHIYWTYQAGATTYIPTHDTTFEIPAGIGRATLNGSKPASHLDQTFISSPELAQTYVQPSETPGYDSVSYEILAGGAGAIAVSSSGIYWAYGQPPYSGDQIWHALLNGSQEGPIITTIPSAVEGVVALTVDGSYIYWTNYQGTDGYGGDGAIGRAELSGTQATHVDPTFVPVNALDVASQGDHLYWTYYANGDIGTARLNGARAASSVRNRFIAGGATYAASVAVGPLPIDTRLPTISGVARNHRTLIARRGSFSGNPTSYSYLWKECNTNGASCRPRHTSKFPLAGDKGVEYTVSPPDIGHTIRVVVTAHSSQGSVSATSAATAIVPYQVPVAISRPVIVGSPVVGKTLTLIHGRYTNHPTSYRDEWMLCGLGGQSCNHQAPDTSVSQPSLPLIMNDEFGVVELREIAVNSHGDSLPISSASTAEVTIATPVSSPAAPTGVTAVAGPGQAKVSFAAPAANGSAITSYTVTASPGGASATGSGSPITVTGLTDGTGYTFTVTATNSVGTGPPSPESNLVIPGGSPAAPTGVTAVAGPGQAQVSFAAPAANGSAITSYTVTASPGGASATGSGSPITVTGLTDGTGYTFTVTATNSVGTGPPSQPSNSVVPAGVPGAPTGVTAVAGHGQATVSFAAPAANGSAITSYTVTASPGGASATGSGSPITVTGLTDGTAYTFTVTATNSVGTGPPSQPSNSVVPFPT